MQEMEQKLREKENHIKFINNRCHEQDILNHKTNSLIGSQFLNLGYEHQKALETARPQSWLDKHRKAAYSIKYSSILNN